MSFLYILCVTCGSDCKVSACNAGDLDLIPGQEDSLEKGMVAHSSILAWRISWTEESTPLQSMGLQRVRHNEQLTHIFQVLTPYQVYNFLPFCRLPFYSVNGFLCCAEAFQFYIVPLVDMDFCCFCFWCHILKILPRPMSGRFFTYAFFQEVYNFGP